MRTRFGRPLACVLALLAWAGAASSAKADDPTVLKRAISSLSHSFDPQKQNQAVERQVLNDLFMGLTELDQTGQVSPGAAYDWSISADGLTYVFHLRADGRWQDGHPVTAPDFVLAFARLFTLGNDARQSAMFSSIRNSDSLAGGTLPIRIDSVASNDFGVRALDALTLEITLDRPFPYLLFVLSKPPAFPVPSHIYATEGEAWVAPETLVSNGAYRLADVQPGEMVKLTRSTHFYASTDSMADVVIHLQPPAGITMGRFMAAGKADISSAIPPIRCRPYARCPASG